MLWGCRSAAEEASVGPIRIVDGQIAAGKKRRVDHALGVVVITAHIAPVAGQVEAGPYLENARDVIVIVEAGGITFVVGRF